MADYFLRVATPVTDSDCMQVLKNAWITVFGSPPKDEAVRLMCAQWGLETGWGVQGYCYNLPNIRTSKYDYTYISGSEKIDGQWVYFDQDNPSDMSRFRAFKTPQDCADAYVDMLARLHKGATSVLQGSCDLEAFSRALSKEYGSGYYTDDYDHYTKALERCYDLIESKPLPAAGPVTGYPVLSPDPRGDPSTWPKDEASGKAASAPAAPAPTADAPSAPPTSQAAARILARVEVRATRGGDPVRIRVDRASTTAAPSSTTASAPPAAAPPPKTASPPPATSTACPPQPKPGEPRRGGRAWMVEIPEVKGRDGPEAREAAFWQEFQKGNYPSFVSLFAPVTMTDKAGRKATFMVSVDYAAIGTDDDWLRMPLSGYHATRVAEAFGCYLPTNKLVMEIYRQAAVKLVAHPFDCQGTGSGTWQRSNVATMGHEDVLQGKTPCKKGQRMPSADGKFNPLLGNHDGVCSISGPHPGVLVSGHMKEVILSHENLAERLAFWGFFTSVGKPIQSGFGCRHGPGYSDYSHGVRMVKGDVDLDGQRMSYAELVTNPAYASLMFDSGGTTCPKAGYPSPPPAKYVMGQ